MQRWTKALWILPVVARAVGTLTAAGLRQVAAEQRAADARKAEPQPVLVRTSNLDALDDAMACTHFPASVQRDVQIELAALHWVAWAARLVRDRDLTLIDERVRSREAIAASMTDAAQDRSCNIASETALRGDHPFASIPAIPPQPNPLAATPIARPPDPMQETSRAADIERARSEGIAEGEMMQEGLEESRARAADSAAAAAHAVYDPSSPGK